MAQGGGYWDSLFPATVANGKVLKAAEKRIIHAAARQFGRDRQRDGESHFERTLCVGETNCEPFICAAGNTAQKEKSTCHQCKAFPSKFSAAPERTEKALDALTHRAFEKLTESSIGHAPDVYAITPIEFEAMKLLKVNIGRFEREVTLENNRYLEFLLKRPGL